MSVAIVRAVIESLPTDIFFRSAITEVVQLPETEVDFALAEIVGDGSLKCYAGIDGPFRKLNEYDQKVM